MPGDLAGHAEAPPEFLLASDLEPGDEFQLSNLATMDADEIPGTYPQYGTFIECVRDGSPIWIECPRSLAQSLVETGISPGDRWAVESISKTDGRWEVEVDA
jgi:hypothetical protein